MLNDTLYDIVCGFTGQRHNLVFHPVQMMEIIKLCLLTFIRDHF